LRAACCGLWRCAGVADPDRGYRRLLAAVVLRWVRDAQADLKIGQDHECWMLTEFLDLPFSEVRERVMRLRWDGRVWHL